MKNKTILITGGAGFIGSNFIHHLINKYDDIQIIVLDALTYAGSLENLPKTPNVQFVYGNVQNADLVDSLMQQSNIVVHFAAESHVTRSIFDNKVFFETDVLGTQVVANSVLRYKNDIDLFIHVSTSEVYGTAESKLMPEEHPLKPMSPYAAAKCGADRLVYSYWETYNIPAVIVRPFNNYGPRQHLEKLIPRFITSCLMEEPLTVHGKGGASRDFMYVEDHCVALEKILIHRDQEDLYGEVFNIGSSIHRSVNEIASTIIKSSGAKNSPLKYIEDRPGQVTRHSCDWSKIKRILGWEPKVSFEEGISKTISWYDQNREWWEKQKWMRHIPIITSEGKKSLH